MNENRYNNIEDIECIKKIFDFFGKKVCVFCKYFVLDINCIY